MSEKSAGKKVPIIGPMEGIKLKKKISAAQKKGLSNPTKYITT